MRTVVVPAALVMLLTSEARGERPLLSSRRKEAEATHVVAGVVKAVYSRDVETRRHGKGTLETRYLLEIEVQGVEKGEGLEEGDLVYARCWRLRKHGAAGLQPGASGHSGIPKEGERVRAYLVRGKYGATGQTDNGWAVVYPNGIDTLKAR